MLILIINIIIIVKISNANLKTIKVAGNTGRISWIFITGLTVMFIKLIIQSSTMIGWLNNMDNSKIMQRMVSVEEY